MKHDGSFPEVNAAFDQMKAHAPQIAANIKGSPLGQMYPEVNWEWLLGKIVEMESDAFDWCGAIQQIKSPTMLLFADADSVRPEHIVEFYQRARRRMSPTSAHLRFVRHPAQSTSRKVRPPAASAVQLDYTLAITQTSGSLKQTD